MNDVKNSKTSYPRVMIAGFGSGDGKTTLSLALLSYLREKYERVSAFKCGPDYIDPLFHGEIMGKPSKNLDPFFMEEQELRESFCRGAKDSDMSLIEAAMGLYDGIGATSHASAYEVAKTLCCPIILCVDARGKGASLIPLIKGFLAADEEGLIKGLILNRISRNFYEKIKPEIERTCKISVLGFLPVMKECGFSSRYLGLNLEERKNIISKIENVKCEFLLSLDDEAFRDIANSAPELTFEGVRENKIKSLGHERPEKAPVIAVARDEAFSFYYEDNLSLLTELGAKIIYFSPLHDSALPKEADGIILGGGYPEKYAKELSENVSMISSVRNAAEKGMPVHGECGGYMYLCKTIKTPDGEWDMCGIFLESAFYAGKSIRFGYIYLEARDEKNGRNYSLRGHEFHHYDVTEAGDFFKAKKASEDVKYSAGRRYKNVIAGFPHIFYDSDISFAADFVKKAAEYKKEKNGTD